MGTGRTFSTNYCGRKLNSLLVLLVLLAHSPEEKAIRRVEAGAWWIEYSLSMQEAEVRREWGEDILDWGWSSVVEPMFSVCQVLN